ncbi:hypothetical protein EGW08_002260 [Elysia chlorotica]|uniref:Uncharacterized protein n=1 Tax=Elysia chlorotica TaxID=188477 RepID=A0A433U848_ELYCH|nr:hypothetical protein EGW08_002260 [Elysia chlorotica]
MLEGVHDSVVKTVQPTIEAGKKRKVVKDVDQAYHDRINNTTLKQNGRGPYLQKRETPEPNQREELRDAGYKFVMPVEIGARGFVGSTAYDPLTELSMCDNKRTCVSSNLLRPSSEDASDLELSGKEFHDIRNFPNSREAGPWCESTMSSPVMVYSDVTVVVENATYRLTNGTEGVENATYRLTNGTEGDQGEATHGGQPERTMFIQIADGKFSLSPDEDLKQGVNNIT